MGPEERRGDAQAHPEARKFGAEKRPEEPRLLTLQRSTDHPPPPRPHAQADLVEKRHDGKNPSAYSRQPQLHGSHVFLRKKERKRERKKTGTNKKAVRLALR